MAVIPADRSRFLDSLHTLGVYDRCRRLRIPAHALPLRCPECSEDAVPHTTKAEAAEVVVVDRLPRWEGTREVAPRASRPEQVKIASRTARNEWVRGLPWILGWA